MSMWLIPVTYSSANRPCLPNETINNSANSGGLVVTFCSATRWHAWEATNKSLQYKRTARHPNTLVFSFFSMSLGLAERCDFGKTGEIVNVHLTLPTQKNLVSLGRVVWRSKVRVTVVRPPSIPFGWKVIPQTADAASVTLRVNLERLSIHFALDGLVMNTELRGRWKC